MADHSTNHNNNLFAATLIAGVAGAALGILFAPKSGKETRTNIKTAAMKAQEKTAHGVESGMEHAKDTRDKLASYIRHTQKDAAEEIDKISKKAKSEIDKIRREQQESRKSEDR
jgi:gas vesicle protein